MQICNKHDEQLKQAIYDNGLNQVGYKDITEKSIEDIAKDMISTIRGTVSMDNYDPFVSAYFEICIKAISILGLSILMEPEICPICASLETINNHIKKCNDRSCTSNHNLDSINEWIEEVVNNQLSFARKNQLVPPLQ